MAGIDLQAIQDAKDALNEERIPHTEYMTVAMNGEVFLLPVTEVASVVRPVRLTPVPMAPDHLIGVGNVRGQIFCLVDPGKVLSLKGKRKEKTKDTRFVLLRHDRVHLGFWADSVSSLHSIPSADAPIDSGKKFEKGTLDTEQGVLPILRTIALFD